jgi:acyl carrier protein
METEIFLKKLQEALEEDVQIKVDTKFSDFSIFDSMSIMMLIAFVDESFNKKISAKEFKELKTVSDLMKVIGTEHFD